MVTHHSSLKIPKFSNSTRLAHIFNFSSLKFFYFLWDPYLSNGQRLLLAYPPNHHLPPFSSLHISFCHHHSHSLTQKLHSQFNQRSRTTKTLKNLTPPKAAHHPQIQNSIHTYLWYTMKKKRKKEELPDQKWASNGAVPCADHRASRSNHFQLFPTEIHRCCGCRFRCSDQIEERVWKQRWGEWAHGGAFQRVIEDWRWWSLSLGRRGSACEWLACEWPVWVVGEYELFALKKNTKKNR